VRAISARDEVAKLFRLELINRLCRRQVAEIQIRRRHRSFLPLRLSRPHRARQRALSFVFDVRTVARRVAEYQEFARSVIAIIRATLTELQCVHLLQRSGALRTVSRAAVLEPRGDGRGPGGVRRLRVSTSAIIFSSALFRELRDPLHLVQLWQQPR
jgi:hypothetical protein